MATVSKVSAPKDPVETEPEGDFFRFPKLPASARDRIWKYSIPSGRVVDVVFDKEQDRYFSFHAIIPAILCTSKEARAIGLKFYTICFGTKSHPALIPFDFSVDCLLFDDWLAPRTQVKKGPPPTSASELARVIGPMGHVEQQNIHRIALSTDFFTYFRITQVLEGMRVIFHNFPSTDYLVFVFEHRDAPYERGPILFRKLELDQWCCERCFKRINNRFVKGVDKASTQSSEQSTSTNGKPSKLQVRFRGISRDVVYDRSSMRTVWRCPYKDKQEDYEQELLQPYSDDCKSQRIANSSATFRCTEESDADEDTELKSDEDGEKLEQDLEEGELEGLLVDALILDSTRTLRHQ